MVAHVALPASRSRPPIARASQPPIEIAAMDLAFALAVALEAHALESIVVLDLRAHGARTIVASAGRAAPSRALGLFAAAMTEGEPIGTSRAYEEGRVHVEVVSLSGVSCVVALRGFVAIDEPSEIAAALREALGHGDDVGNGNGIGNGNGNGTQDDASADDDGELDFDLDWADSPNEALRGVIG